MDRKPTYGELEQRVSELEDRTARYMEMLEKHRLQESTAQSYLDIAGVIIVAIDARGQVTLINKKGCRILGYEEKELIGKDWFQMCLPKEIREDVKLVFQKLVAGEIKNIEYYQNSLLTKNGEQRTIAWYNTLLKDDSDNIVGTLSSGEDVTEKERAQQELHEAHEELAHFSKELEKMVQERTEELLEKNKQLIEAERVAALGKIADRVAHELRNPLTVIGGFSRRMYEQTADSDPNKKYLKIIVSEMLGLESRLSEIIKIRDQKERILNGD